MTQNAYRKLARRLDAIPNGYPSTNSGVELELLAKMFTPQQARLTSVMRLTCEPAAEIAARLELDPEETYLQLNKMTRLGLIRARKKDGQLFFGLMPFAVGIYEEQLPRMDAEMAGLMEDYFQETEGHMVSQHPSIHRVIPVMEPIPFDLEIFPHEQAAAMLEGAKSWGVRDCICRVQRELIGQGCDHPVENCLIFAPVENAFEGSETTRTISKEQALDILQETEDAGLIHSTGNYRDHHYYICNCCTCSCGVIRGVAEFDIPSAVVRSAFRVEVDESLCTTCGDCLDRCQFDALTMPDLVAEVNPIRCVGCGLCTQACGTEALFLVRRPENEIPPVPTNIKAWMAERAAQRGIDIFEVL